MKRIKKPTLAELALWKRVTDTTIPLDPGIQDFEKVLNQLEQQISKTEEHSNWPGRNVRMKEPFLSGPDQVPVSTGPALMRNIPLAVKLDGFRDTNHPLDDKTRKKIAKGKINIDATLDLHGLTQDRAHQALRRFLLMAVAADLRVVLVITGKGDGGGGVLKSRVPDWLQHGDLSTLTNGFRNAGRTHGGDGALYVRVRRQRGR